MSIQELLQEFLRHRVTVIRRRTEFLLAEARKRKHTVEGLLIAQSEIDQVIATVRNAASRADARVALQEIEVPAELVARALGDAGFRDFVEERGPRRSTACRPTSPKPSFRCSWARWPTSNAKRSAASIRSCWKASSNTCGSCPTRPTSAPSCGKTCSNSRRNTGPSAAPPSRKRRSRTSTATT